MPFGAIFGGLAQGAQAGMDLAQKSQNLDLKRAMMERQQRVEGLNYLVKMRPQLEDAALIEDPKTRSSAITDLLAGYQQNFGHKIAPDAVKWAIQNPDHFKAALDMTGQHGIPLDQALHMMQDPTLRATFIISQEKGGRERAAQGALGPTAPGGVAAPGEQAPLGSGINFGGVMQPGGIAGAPAPTAPATEAPLQGPTPTLERRAQQLERDIRDLESRMVLAGKGKNTQAVRTLGDLMKGKQDELASIRNAPALQQAKQNNEPLSPAEVQAYKDQFPAQQAQFSVGMDRGTANLLVAKLQQLVPVAAGATQTPVGVPAPAPVIAPQGGLPAAPDLTTAGRAQTAADIARRAQPLPEDLVREAEVQRLGITTRGAFEDAKAKGQLKGVRSPWQVASDAATATHEAASSAKVLDEITARGESARNKLGIYSTMAQAAARLGPTGQWVTPLLDQASNLAQLLGVQNPERLAPKALVEKLQNQLAVEMTGQMKGQQSNRELETALRSSPGAFTSPEGLAILMKIGEITALQEIARNQQAAAWQAQHHNLFAKDDYGRTFQQAWDDNLAREYRDNGNIGDRIAKFFGSNPKDILKGKVTKVR